MVATSLGLQASQHVVMISLWLQQQCCLQQFIAAARALPSGLMHCSSWRNLMALAQPHGSGGMRSSERSRAVWNLQGSSDPCSLARLERP